MGLMDYARPSVTTDVVLFRIKKERNDNNRKKDIVELQVLLIKREEEPNKGDWSLPGGFVNIDEEITENAYRKLREKTGISGSFYMEQLYTWGDLNRDSRGRVISVSYLGLCNETTYTCETPLENTVSQWFNVYDVLSGKIGKLAFDHLSIIQYALDRVRNKLEYTDIALNLLSDEFTISDCQCVYEAILNRQILNFRRKVSDYVMPLNKLVDNEGRQFRPAELFTRKIKNSKF